MRIAFMGTPDFSVSILDALVTAGHELACVYTQPPRPAGRGQQLQPGPVQRRAEALGLPVRHPKTLRTAEAQAAFAGLDLDCAVVAAYGLILPQPVLDAPRKGCLNVHASLLPRWRGAAPIQRAILSGDTESGVTIMQMEAGLDTGPMLLWESLPIGPRETAQSLHDRLAEQGARLIVTTLERIAAGTLQATVQPVDGVTYAAKLDKDEGRLDFTDTADNLDRRVRALTPWPGCWFVAASGERIKVLAAEPVESNGEHGSAEPGRLLPGRETVVACSGGALRLTLLQRPGRGPVDGVSFRNGWGEERPLVSPAADRKP